MEMLRIPHDRMGELLGKDGENKKKIENHFNVKIIIRDEGEVTIEGDSADTFFAKDVVAAIGRGFSIDDAVKLFKDEYAFVLIDLREHFGTERALTRMKGRIIGEGGKIKKEIEAATESMISVYGHTVAIIAPAENMGFAKEAIGKIIDGAPHTAVLNYLHGVRERIFAMKLKG
ncbi:RNA-processing protein [Candidatus Micrarchaeota archaeon]|nr:RNA-processing protein [Candidatus Micrarchaeota archaeon]